MARRRRRNPLGREVQAVLAQARADASARGIELVVSAIDEYTIGDDADWYQQTPPGEYFAKLADDVWEMDDVYFDDERDAAAAYEILNVAAMKLGGRPRYARKRNPTAKRERNARTLVQRHVSDRRWKQRIPGGTTRAPASFKRQSLIRGALVELEHTTDPLVALEIAMDHLDEDPDYYGKLAKIHHENPRLTKAEQRALENRLRKVLSRIPAEMQKTGPSYRRRVVEEINMARWRFERGQPDLAVGHVAAAEAAAGLLGDLSTLTYADVTRREAELRAGTRQHNPDPDACALGRWAWDRSTATCGPGAPPATPHGASEAARRLAEKRWTLPERERRVAARILRL